VSSAFQVLSQFRTSGLFDLGGLLAVVIIETKVQNAQLLASKGNSALSFSISATAVSSLSALTESARAPKTLKQNTLQTPGKKEF